MEGSGASPAGGSQPSPGPSGELPASAQADLSAPGEDEGSEAIRERVVAGIKVLNRERDKLYKLRAELKRLRRQREGLHSQKRGSMDPEIQLAKVRVDHQETIVAMMEGRDGPFKEKFCNDKTFGRVTKMEVEEKETPSSDPLPPQGEVQLLSERTIAMRSKISKMVIVIVLLFTICWGPIQLFSLFQGFYPGFQANYATYKIKTWANCMSYANSSINPIVYGFMGASFRKSFKKAFPFMFRNKVRDGSITSRTVNNEMKFVAMESTNNELK